MNPRVLSGITVALGTVLVTVGVAMGDQAGVHPLYVWLLLVLCASPLLWMRRFNDRYALLVLFAASYFMLFGALDLDHLLFGLPAGTDAPVGDAGLLNQTELLILCGYAVLQAAYLAACQWRRVAAADGAVRDWPERTLVWGGLVLWVVCTWATWHLNVDLITKITNDVVASAYAGMSQLQVILYMLAGYFQPVGIVIVAYAQARHRRGWLVPVLAGMVAVEMLFGFVSDSKGQVLIGLALIALTKLLVDARVPVMRLMVVVAVAVLAFPLLQANRTARGTYDLNHADAARQIGRTLQRAFDLKSQVTAGPDRADTLLERMSLKANVGVIVERTGRGVPYQNGHTLAPLLGVFIPRVLWSDKEEIKTGQLFNQAFSLDDSPDIYISTSHLGELYWNFGWTGSLLGMALIGLMFGVAGAYADLSRNPNITGILVLLSTVKLVALGFESTIATQYSVWLRSLLGIGLLHVLLARPVRPVRPPADAAAADRHAPQAPAGSPATPVFPNLMR